MGNGNNTTYDATTYAALSKNVLEKIFKISGIIENIIECSPECCPRCGKNKECNGSSESCAEFHLEDINRILKNLEKQEEYNS